MQPREHQGQKLFRGHVGGVNGPPARAGIALRFVEKVVDTGGRVGKHGRSKLRCTVEAHLNVYLQITVGTVGVPRHQQPSTIVVLDCCKLTMSHLEVPGYKAGQD